MNNFFITHDNCIGIILFLILTSLIFFGKTMSKKNVKKDEWNYHECKECYIMYPHLNVPKKCFLCGNNMKKNYNKKTLKIIKIKKGEKKKMGKEELKNQEKLYS